MKCKNCNASTRVLETREGPEHWVMRRHRCENGHEFRSYQVLDTVAAANTRWLKNSHARALSGTERRRAGFTLREEIRRRLAAGDKYEVIRHELGCSTSTIHRARHETL